MNNCVVKWLLIPAILGLAVCCCIGCGRKEPVTPGFSLLSGRERKAFFEEMDPANQGLDSWRDLAQPLQRSLNALRSKEKEQKVLDTPQLRLTVQDLRESLRHLLHILPELEADPGLLAAEFACYELQPGPLFTGYYQPRIAASLEQTPEYSYPLYALPRDLHRVDLSRFHPRWEGQRLIYRIQDGKIAPYHTRAEIDGQNVLEGKAKIVAWARDVLDVFFLHIQGSGQLELPNKDIVHIGYAGKNGHEYVSLGRVLVDRGHMSYKGLSMQSIRTFLSRHPELLPEILFTNPSYVFFRIRPDGPYGAMGQILTPMVSLATDPKMVPLGALVAFEVDLPRKERGTRLTGLGLAQDVGGAIKGRHVDLYCGSGPQAGQIAGGLKSQGRLVLVLSKSVLETVN
jgi:membrane-bound lytic murein transglycosylase A